MDRLNVSMDVLRRLAKEADDPNCVVLAERAINDYLKSEIDALKAAIERIGKAIDEEAAKGQGEDWSLMVGYVQSCRENARQDRRMAERLGLSERLQKNGQVKGLLVAQLNGDRRWFAFNSNV